MYKRAPDEVLGLVIMLEELPIGRQWDILTSAFDWAILDVLVHFTLPGVYIRVAQQEFVHCLWTSNLREGRIVMSPF